VCQQMEEDNLRKRQLMMTRQEEKDAGVMMPHGSAYPQFGMTR